MNSAKEQPIHSHELQNQSDQFIPFTIYLSNQKKDYKLDHFPQSGSEEE